MTAVATSSRSETPSLEMSEWNHRQEDLMDMIGTLEHEMGDFEFNKIELETDATFVACGCGRGGINNFCNWA